MDLVTVFEPNVKPNIKLIVFQFYINNILSQILNFCFSSNWVLDFSNDFRLTFNLSYDFKDTFELVWLFVKIYLLYELNSYFCSDLIHFDLSKKSFLRFSNAFKWSKCRSCIRTIICVFYAYRICGW